MVFGKNQCPCILVKLAHLVATVVLFFAITDYGQIHVPRFANNHSAGQLSPKVQTGPLGRTNPTMNEFGSFISKSGMASSWGPLVH